MAGHLTPELANKERRAVALRVAGMDYDAIAAELGYADKGGAYKAVQRALKRSIAESADELRKIEDRRLDAMLAGVWNTASTGVYDSIDRALRISKRRSELLGLDAPVKIAPTTPDGKEAIPVGLAAILTNLPAGIRAAVVELATEQDDPATTGGTPGGDPEAG